MRRRPVTAENWAAGREGEANKKFLNGGLEGKPAETRSILTGSQGYRSGAGTGGRLVRCSYPCCSTEDMAMRNYDFSNFSRSSVGFEPLFNLINDAQKRFTEEGGFPPYDIVRKDDSTYVIRLAAAGFTRDELTITAKQNLLTVSGQKNADDKRQYLYEGISTRSFERQFSLADHVEPRAASYEHGILEIELHQQVPEAAKPRKIAINGGASARLVN